MTVATALACSGSEQQDVDRESYLDANVAVLEALPEVPGSQQVDIRWEPYFDAPQDHTVLGYQTTVVLQLPPGWGIDDVFAFYEEALDPSWSAGRVAASNARSAPDPRSSTGAQILMLPQGPRLIAAGPQRELLVVREPTSEGDDATFELVIDHGARQAGSG